MSGAVYRDVERKMMDHSESGSIGSTHQEYETESDLRPIEAELVGLGNDINELGEHIVLLRNRLRPVLSSQDVEQTTARRGMLTDESSSEHVKALVGLRNLVMSLTDGVANLLAHLDI